MMRRAPLIAALALLAAPVQAQQSVVDAVLDTHVLPNMAALSESTSALAETAAESCDPSAEPLRAAYHAAFDAWTRVSHLRFGPAAREDRGFALAFWPDSRGTTPRSLAELMAEEDAVVETAEGFAEVSVAARGFFALEFLLYDETTMALADSSYGCTLIARVAADIARTSAAIAEDWRDVEAPAMRAPDQAADNLRRFYASMAEGLQFTMDLRLGRPMGTFDRPRPRRAEAWRSGRSLRNVELALQSMGELAALLAAVEGADAEAVNAAFTRAIDQAAALDDPAFAGVATPQGRIGVEVLQTRVREAAADAQATLAPALGATLTFNALDGD